MYRYSEMRQAGHHRETSCSICTAICERCMILP
jgi:hypothetical protein